MKYDKSKPIDKKQIILDTYYKYREYSVEEIASVFKVTKQYVSLLVIAEEKEQAKRLLGVE